MSDTQDPIQSLEAQLDRLIQQCQRLQRENAELKANAADWQRERTRLVEKNEVARTRVEAMISRLKSLEAE